MSINNLPKLLISIISIFVSIPIIFIPSFSSDAINSNNSINISNDKYNFEITSNDFVWPVPGYTRITSYFGRRSSPTKYASSFHQGIDIRCACW